MPFFGFSTPASRWKSTMPNSNLRQKATSAVERQRRGPQRKRDAYGTWTINMDFPRSPSLFLFSLFLYCCRLEGRRIVDTRHTKNCHALTRTLYSSRSGQCKNMDDPTTNITPTTSDGDYTPTTTTDEPTATTTTSSMEISKSR
jgi:hypothetical protein